ncbi:type II secretion system F family protein [Amphiplicatus metriothermophilus]|uniref:Tight adherence protein B n=1 Tax=Amphiplicatus metriothermophilus TaxID=1519374 RepID=A0A239PJC1_9PROT|nr:type II secretion system F family protein [Amphiplicatus metriothermophilus]MBB5518006.1 tight adherence protein B [Amphiplicatus metriothermophilus]SNT67660.1 tight adherence protein B [Amphiplicatus metriothermophilus]
MDQQIIIVAVLGVVCLGALAFALSAPSQKDKAKRRIAEIETARPARRAATAAGGDRDSKDRRRKLTEALAKIEDKNKELKKKRRASLAQQIEQAGLTFSVQQFYIGSVVCALVFGVIGVISGQKLWITGLLILIGGFGVPRWFVNFARKRRQKKFANEFSNAIDVIVRGVKSGLPVNECLKIIAAEAPKPVNEEFHMLTEGIRVGLSLEQALERMFERMPLQEVRFFAIVLMIQQKTGGNLAEALNNLASVLRGRKLMVGKVKALSAEAKASAMIIGALPFLVMGAVSMTSPDYLAPLFTTKPGNFILIGAGLWMGTGIMVMKKMINIKV